MKQNEAAAVEPSDANDSLDMAWDDFVAAYQEADDDTRERVIGSDYGAETKEERA